MNKVLFFIFVGAVLSSVILYSIIRVPDCENVSTSFVNKLSQSSQSSAFDVIEGGKLMIAVDAMSRAVSGILITTPEIEESVRESLPNEKSEGICSLGDSTFHIYSFSTGK